MSLSPDRVTLIPDTAMYVILSYLPDDAVVSLASTSSSTRSATKGILDMNIYWSEKISSLLGVAIQPNTMTGVDMQKAYKEFIHTPSTVLEHHVYLDHAHATRLLLQLGIATPREEKQAFNTALSMLNESTVLVFVDTDKVGGAAVWSSLFSEAAHSMPDIVEAIIRTGRVFPNALGQGLLRSMNTRHSEHITRLLIDNPNISISYYNISLVKASMRGSVETVRLLLGRGGINPRYNNSEALREAVAYNNLDVVRLLIDDGRSDPHANNDEALRTALRLKQGGDMVVLLSTI